MQSTTTTRADAPEPTTLRAPGPADGRSLWALADRVGLDLNSPYAYVLWGDHFADTSVVAVEGGDVVGFAMGFRTPSDPDVLFIWQIGVDEAARGTGLASRMLDELVERTDAVTVEATVTPSNAASAALFRGLGARHGSDVEETVAYGESLFPDGHEAEVRFRIPVAPAGRASAC